MLRSKLLPAWATISFFWKHRALVREVFAAQFRAVDRPMITPEGARLRAAKRAVEDLVDAEAREVDAQAAAVARERVELVRALRGGED